MYVGSVATALIPTVRRLGLAPSSRAWDFLSLALSVIAADEGCSRSASADGWTRSIDLEVGVTDPAFWNGRRDILQDALGFLSTDRWSFEFVGGGLQPAPPQQAVARPEECVCLLSGGLDSLIGALDLRAQEKHPLLVSQVAKGDKQTQRELGRMIAGSGLHLQLNHNARPPSGFSERSQRSRSIIFMAYGVLAATCLAAYQDGGTVDLYVPENGFISLNVPLTPLRMASHSTRTTHPVFMGRLQDLIDAAGLRVRLVNPYILRTKGEMLSGCADRAFLLSHAGETTSCGRYARTAFTQCGRCVPCLIRRASFHAAGIADTTPPYRYDISLPGRRHRDFEDVRAAAMAVGRVETAGLKEWLGGALNAAQLGGDTGAYEDVARRGIGELGTFLRSVGVI
ncbi:hypothetical protein MKK58_17780 [Methylobacterium sp. J-078]|uniref:Qat anti-phage system QueC-like protein QatC n=1 Tax=Methylobacterium sp. J-078 TaxID=2836657 RepID=UPI001FBB596D|nr:Qat anti-phage system QueC-like protein QatC [Methylobacterium sp. J-078]MCJ2046369.1 hypothetical protein [Methylobacterium sp. J-078]